MSRPHPSSIHFICLPTSRQTINTLVQRCNAMLQVKQLSIDESRKIAADLCVAAAILLVEPHNIIPSRHPRIIPLPQPQQNKPFQQRSRQNQPQQQQVQRQQVQQRQLQQQQIQQQQIQQQLLQQQQLPQTELQIQQSRLRQLEQVQPLRPARNAPPPLNFSLYPSASPTAIRLSSTRAATPLTPMTSPFVRPTGPKSALDVQNARSLHLLMLLQCFEFMIAENTRFKSFLLIQRDLLGFVSPTAATPNRLRDAALRPFKNLSQFSANYFDHLSHENHAMHQALLRRKLALEAYRNEMNTMQNNSKNDAAKTRVGPPSAPPNPQNDTRTFQQKVSKRTERFTAIAKDSEAMLKELANTVIMSFRVACAPAEAASDAVTKLPPTSMKNFVKNVERNVGELPGLPTFPAPLVRRYGLEPIPDASSLAAAETRFSPFLTDVNCAAILQRSNPKRLDGS